MCNCTFIGWNPMNWVKGGPATGIVPPITDPGLWLGWSVLSAFYTNLCDISSSHACIQRQAGAWTCSVTPQYPDSYRGKRGPPRGPKSLKQSVIHQARLSGDIRGKGRKGMNNIREGRSNRERQKQAVGWGGGTEKEADWNTMKCKKEAELDSLFV